MSMRAKLAYLLCLLIFFVAGLWAASQDFWQAEKPNPYATLGGEFTLNSANGEVKLSDYKGKLVALYFGFMSCPDVCPTALSSLAAAMRSLDKAQQSQIQPLFISVDPARDTLENMAAYTTYFHPSMLGLSGDLPYLEQLTRQYGAYFRHIPMEDSALGYTVDHTSRIYLIDREGKLITTIPHATSVTDISAQLQQYL
ncbi:MAG: SCO family protein [Gammaproteobacteria bacterium]|jgi:protein SCO1/2|nr:SCO family protein [Gammaproteobacteria bacterium]